MRQPKLLALLAVLALPWGCDRPDVSAVAAAQPQDEPRWTSPPGPDTPEVQALLERVDKALSSGTDVSAVLTDPAWLPLHERTSFRELIARHARSARVKLVTASEPGDRLVVTGTLRQADGRPLAGALVYAYQTDARGWYSDRAPHYSGGEGDHRHARLFGYLKTGSDGQFEIDTIRPQGYPRSTLPQHIHIQVFVDGQSRLVSEINFDDDPRMTPSTRRQSEQSGFYVVPVEHGAGGVQRCRVEVTVH
jgi:Dioxygenase